jgi:hypothetical protein
LEEDALPALVCPEDGPDDELRRAPRAAFVLFQVGAVLGRARRAHVEYQTVIKDLVLESSRLG